MANQGRPSTKGRRRKQEYGGRKMKLTAPQITGYVTRFVNDVGSKIHEKTVEDDWEFVLRKEIEQNGSVIVGDSDINQVLSPGEKVSKPVGKVGDLTNARAFLLKKKKEYFDADYRASQKRLDDIEKQIKQPKLQNQHGTVKIQ